MTLTKASKLLGRTTVAGTQKSARLKESDVAQEVRAVLDGAAVASALRGENVQL